MKVVVVTGSTRGLGLGLCEAFAALGCRTVVSGRTQPAVDAAVARLRAAGVDEERVLGRACDVTRLAEVEQLWAAAAERFGGVDVWINNAGVGSRRAPLWDVTPAELRAVVDTNLLGALHGTRVAMRGMLAQGRGALYQMEGLGSDGRIIEGLSLYGASKRGLAYLTDALAREARGTPVIVGAIRPGMVMTDLITGQYRDRPEDWARDRRVFDILADSVERVAPWIARRVLANRRTGARISWLTPGKALWRFATAPVLRRRVWPERL